MREFKLKSDGTDRNWDVVGIEPLHPSVFACRNCNNVVEDPVRLNCCEELFCRKCSLSSTNDYVCKFCKCIFTALLYSTTVLCTADKCKEKVAYFRRENHLEKKCLGEKRCEFCRQVFKVREKHICVKAVRSVIQNIEADYSISAEIKEKQFLEYMKKICGYASESIQDNNNDYINDDASIIEVLSSSFDELEIVAEEEESELIETTLDSARVYDVPDDTMDTDLDFSDFSSGHDEFYEYGYNQPTNHEATDRK